MSCFEKLCLVVFMLILHDSKAVRPVKGHTRSGESNYQVLTKYANLLKSIVRVNEERVEAIRKIANLQDYMLTRNRLKFDDYDDSDEEPGPQTGENKNEPPKYRRKAHKKKQPKYSPAMCDNVEIIGTYGRVTPELITYCEREAYHKCSLKCVQILEKECPHAYFCNYRTVEEAQKCMYDCKKITPYKDDYE